MNKDLKTLKALKNYQRLQKLEYFTTHIKGSAVTTVPVETYLKEKLLTTLKNK